MKARPATGQVVARHGKRGTSFGLRFRAYGPRHYMTARATSREEAERELGHVLADVERGLWKPTVREAPAAPTEDPGFHVFASEWLASKRLEGLQERSLEDYKWALSYHLLPFFKDHALVEITVQEVDRYKLAKARKGTLTAGSVNKTITRLAQILEPPLSTA